MFTFFRLWIFVTVILLITVLASETFARKKRSEKTDTRKVKAQRQTYETHNKMKDMQQSERKMDTAKENYPKNKKHVLMEKNAEQILEKNAKATLSNPDRKLKHKRSIQEKDIERVNAEKNKNSKKKSKHSKDELKYVQSNKNKATRELKESEKNNMKNCQDSQLCSESNRYLKQDKNKRKLMNDEEVKNSKDNIVRNQKNKRSINSKESENINAVDRKKKKAKPEGNTDKLTETDEQLEYSVDEKYKVSKYKKDQIVSCKNGEKNQKQSKKDEKESKIVEEVMDDPLEETPLQEHEKIIGEKQNYLSNNEEKEVEEGEVEEEYDNTEENCLR